MIRKHLPLLTLLLCAGACRTTGDSGGPDAADAQSGTPAVTLNPVKQGEGPDASPLEVSPGPLALPSEHTNASRGLLQAMEAALAELQVVTSKP